MGVLSPARLMAAFGTADTPDVRLLVHYLASRNLALGAVALAAPPPQLGRLARLAAAFNLLDLLLVLRDRRAGGLSPRTTRLLLVTSGGFALVSTGAARLLGQPG